MEPYPKYLKPGTSYTVVVEAVAPTGDSSRAAKKIIMDSDTLLAVIAGGSSQQVPNDATAVIDASGSQDLNLPPTARQNLTYFWSCIITAGARNGQSCAYLQKENSTAKITIDGALMIPYKETYTFIVVIRSTSPSDIRTSSASVIFTAAPKGSPQVTILSPALPKFNPVSTLVLQGILKSSVDSFVTWSVSQEGSPISIVKKTITPISTNYSTAAAQFGTMNTLGIFANTFQPGLVIVNLYA